jgi:predicted Zn-dependent protease
MELGARAGFDPRSGITLWQKMGAASSGAPPQWLSTHPSGSTRIAEMEANLPRVMPLYDQARVTRAAKTVQ